MNHLQTEAIEYINGPLLVLAGAGSGKTTILSEKVTFLHFTHHTPLQEILALTFTNQAVSHFKTELKKRLPETFEQVHVSTFHELGRKMIQKHLYAQFIFLNEYAKRQLIDEMLVSISQQLQGEFKAKERRLVQRFGFKGTEPNLFDTMKEQLTEEELQKFLKRHRLLVEKKKSMSQFLQTSNISQLISKFKSELFLPISFIKPEKDIFRPYQEDKKITEIIVKSLPTEQKQRVFFQVFSKYEALIKEKKAIDFEDMMLLPIKLMLKNPELLQHYQTKWSHVMIDEYQDTNQLQYHFIQLLSQQTRSLCAVGDDYQTVYGWRGSDYKKITQFQQDFKDAKIITLEQNYRNSKKILAAANELIKQNKGQHHKNLYTDSVNDDPIFVHSAPTFQEEAQWISVKIQELLTKGYQPKDIAILYRHNQDAKTLEKSLSQQQLPYRISNERSIFDSKDIHYTIRYFSFLHERTNKSLFQYTLAYFYPSIQPKTLYEIGRESVFHEDFVAVTHRFVQKHPYHTDHKTLTLFLNHVADLSVQIDRLSPLQFLHYFFSLVNMNQISEHHRKEKNDYYSLKTFRLISHLKEVVSLYERIHPKKTTHDLITFLRQGDVHSWYDIHRTSNDLQLMTIHSAKGLEFPVVFLIGFQEDIFPSPFSSSANDLEEERRLCYVAFTRAKEFLFLTHACEKSSYRSLPSEGDMNISPFFHEFSADYSSFI